MTLYDSVVNANDSRIRNQCMFMISFPFREEFLADINQIHENAVIYNGDPSIFCTASRVFIYWSSASLQLGCNSLTHSLTADNVTLSCFGHISVVYG